MSSGHLWHGFCPKNLVNSVNSVNAQKSSVNAQKLVLTLKNQALTPKITVNTEKSDFHK